MGKEFERYREANQQGNMCYTTDLDRTVILKNEVLSAQMRQMVQAARRLATVWTARTAEEWGFVFTPLCLSRLQMAQGGHSVSSEMSTGVKIVERNTSHLTYS